MKFKENEILLAIVSAFFLVLSLVGAVWTFTSGLIAGGIDGIMLLLIALMIAGVFALQLLLIARDAGIVKFPAAAAAPAKKAAAAAPAPKPAAPAAATPAAKPAAPSTTTEAK